ncbi:cyclic GMP-AMP phosphodiesterase SMPDL3A [Paramormyrops kingsleyae]|uniref:Sphingomyelin phosphodiesterase acid like 3A n=1 Tax=Paramormyrops kingsleyae TaxID=1676925 RepID=A0A3B3SSL2_9TELE|nr:acid sphingomyelinase-like phosphodiesterase 3a [Paramormyrops kingsleyae]
MTTKHFLFVTKEAIDRWCLTNLLWFLIVMDPKAWFYICALIVRGYLPLSALPIADRSWHVNTAVVGKFWHISDLHLDPSYHLTEDRTKVCLSSKGYPASDPGDFGDFFCDSPYQLILSAFDFMKQQPQQTDFIIWTGDSPPHVPVDELSTDLVIQIIRNMTDTIRKFFPNLPVYPALGNHDYWPQDQLPVSTSKVYQAAADLWEPWLIPEALKTLREGGFYSQLVQPDLRLVSLNTNLYYGPNKATVNVSDPAGQFSWLVETLERSRASKERVYIIAHVPVGYLPYAINTTAMREVHNEKLVEIFRNYSDIIAAQFYGHTHRDSVMVLQDDRGNPLNSVFVTPALTPIRSAAEPYSNNPGLRVYEYDPQEFTIVDLFQYFLNLTEANREKRPDWRLEYTMTKAFHMKDVRPQSLLRLAESFTAPQSDAFDKYFNHFMVSYNDTVVCQGICKIIQVCSVQFLDQASYSQCIKGKAKTEGIDYNVL